jgi:hypothetical protein
MKTTLALLLACCAVPAVARDCDEPDRNGYYSIICDPPTYRYQPERRVVCEARPRFGDPRYGQTVVCQEE